jgi:GTP cyclohydrolase I
MQKTDPTVGWTVHEHLKSKGIETPMTYDFLEERRKRSAQIVANIGNKYAYLETDWKADERVGQLVYHVTEIMKSLGLDITDDSLKGTPNRVAEMFVNEMFAGLDYTNFPKITVIENKMASKDEFVLETGISVDSACEHHLVVIDGVASVAYIPKAKVLGLSKMNRIVRFFASRPQVQERLTAQIAETLSFLVESPDVAVFVDAKHYCVKARGVRDAGSSTSTFHGTGRFADVTDPIRAEFLSRTRK